jgi:hypothetical protein
MAALAEAEGNGHAAKRKLKAFDNRLNALDQNGQLDQATVDTLETCAKKQLAKHFRTIFQRSK